MHLQFQPNVCVKCNCSGADKMGKFINITRGLSFKSYQLVNDLLTTDGTGLEKMLNFLNENRVEEENPNGQSNDCDAISCPKLAEDLRFLIKVDKVVRGNFSRY